MTFRNMHKKMGYFKERMLITSLCFKHYIQYPKNSPFTSKYTLQIAFVVGTKFVNIRKPGKNILIIQGEKKIIIIQGETSKLNGCLLTSQHDLLSPQCLYPFPSKYYLKRYSWEFPCSPVVRTWCFHCHGPSGVPPSPKEVFSEEKQINK